MVCWKLTRVTANRVLECWSNEFKFSSLEAVQSGREHEPGPRGSPQLPHAPDVICEPAELFACTANTESFEVSFLLWHLGQTAFSVPMSRVSNGCSQFSQMYSKIGILLFFNSLHQIEGTILAFFYSPNLISALPGPVLD